MGDGINEVILGELTTLRNLKWVIRVVVFVYAQLGEIELKHRDS